MKEVDLIVNDDGTSEENHFLDYKLHRADGPAVIYRTADKSIDGECYFIDDELHRLDGPAIWYTTRDGSIEIEYYIHGDFLSYEEWLQHPLVVEYNTLNK